MKQSVTVGGQLLWSGRYGCNNGRYGCAIVMSYTEINKAVSQWRLTFDLCVSVTWPLTCAFHIPCTHIPEIIDMHRGVCDKLTDCRPEFSNIFAVTRCYHDDVIKWKHVRVTGPLSVNLPGTSEFPSQRPVTRSFVAFFYLRLNKRLRKQSRRRWCERRHPAHYDVTIMLYMIRVNLWSSWSDYGRRWQPDTRCLVLW